MKQYLLILNESKQRFLFTKGIYPVLHNDYYRNNQALRQALKQYKILHGTFQRFY